MFFVAGAPLLKEAISSQQVIYSTEGVLDRENKCSQCTASFGGHLFESDFSSSVLLRTFFFYLCTFA